MTFDEFLEARPYNAWLKEPGLEVYVRKNLIYKGLIDIANVNAKPKMGKGSYTRFLDRLDPVYPLMIENVLSDRFADYHRRRGWVEIPCPYGIPNFLNRLAVDQGLGPIAKALV